MINKNILTNSDIFKLNSSEDLVNFIFNVECDNSEKISELVRNNVDIFFEVYSTLNNIQDNISSSGDDLSEDIIHVKELILELHSKLLLVDKHYNDISKFLDVLSDDKKLMWNSVMSNKEMIL